MACDQYSCKLNASLWFGSLDERVGARWNEEQGPVRSGFGRPSIQDHPDIVIPRDTNIYMLSSQKVDLSKSTPFGSYHLRHVIPLNPTIKEG